ncbi:MAG: hypothetical protein WD895_08630 [Acidimicrobiia bacterium]
MNEIGERLTWVLGAVVAAIAVILILRQMTGRHRPVAIQQAKLGPGVYLFTSAACPDCESARRVLLGAIGPSGFVEVSWESDPETFRELGVDAVPATLVVSDSHGSTLYPGRPDRALEVLNP